MLLVDKIIYNNNDICTNIDINSIKIRTIPAIREGKKEIFKRAFRSVNNAVEANSSQEREKERPLSVTLLEATAR